MTARYAIPFVILAVLFLPLPFAASLLVFIVLLAARPRGESGPAGAVVRLLAGPSLLRSPPR